MRVSDNDLPGHSAEASHPHACTSSGESAVTNSLSYETKRLPPVTLTIAGEIVVVGIYPAYKVAACRLGAGEENLACPQYQIGERQGRSVQGPDVDGHSRGIFQILQAPSHT